MTRPTIVLAVVLATLAGLSPVSAVPSDTATAIGVDVGATAAGAFVGALSAGASVELPLSRGWGVDLEPSFYAASGTGVTILQVNAAALGRFYFMSLLVPPSRPVSWGPFAAAGLVGSYAHVQGDSTLDVLSVGTTIRAGYRLVFGDRGVFFEPSVGFMALLGGRLGSAGTTLGTNAGVTLGLVAGWRF